MKNSNYKLDRQKDNSSDCTSKPIVFKDSKALSYGLNEY